MVSKPNRAPYPVKITLDEMRSSGVADIETSADGRADDVRLSDIEPDFVCTAYGKRDADVRPKFGPAKMGTV